MGVTEPAAFVPFPGGFSTSSTEQSNILMLLSLRPMQLGRTRVARLARHPAAPTLDLSTEVTGENCPFQSISECLSVLPSLPTTTLPGGRRADRP